MVELLLDCGASMHPVDARGHTALHRAAENVHCDPVVVVEALLAAGADPQACDAKGATPLHLAAECGTAGVARALLQAGADVTLCDHEGRTLRDRAADLRRLLGRVDRRMPEESLPPRDDLPFDAGEEPWSVEPSDEAVEPVSLGGPEVPTEDSALSVRVVNTLRGAGMATMGDVAGRTAGEP